MWLGVVSGFDVDKLSSDELAVCGEEVVGPLAVTLGVDDPDFDPDMVGVGVRRSPPMTVFVLAEEATVSNAVGVELATFVTEAVVSVDGVGLVDGDAPGLGDGCAGGPVGTLGAVVVGVANAMVI
jgi:hypothetical protein